MSGRGGRGGRGRGRFGGRGSLTHELIRDNLEDLGIDQQQVAAEDKLPPPNYPMVELPYAPSAEDIDPSPLEIEERLKQRIKNAGEFIYFDSPKVSLISESNLSATHQIESTKLKMDLNKSEWSKYIPMELLESSAALKARAVRAARKDELNFKNLEQAENGGDDNLEERKKSNDDVSENEELELDGDDFELDDDYGVNHYDSDIDGGDGDDAEAVF